MAEIKPFKRGRYLITNKSFSGLDYLGREAKPGSVVDDIPKADLYNPDGTDGWLITQGYVEVMPDDFPLTGSNPTQGTIVPIVKPVAKSEDKGA